MSKPSSLADKKQESDDWLERRWVYVHELRSILAEFEDSDWLEINTVGNINVARDGNPQLASIDMLWARVDHWEDANA